MSSAAEGKGSAAPASSLPALKASASGSGKRSAAAAPAQGHKSYHKCTCYGHEKSLPDYKMLQMPRTNNYYAATGGCPCIPRAAAHPGSWRLREAQMRSSTHRCGNGCINKSAAASAAASSHSCCQHTGSQYGWRPGPHSVKGKNTAATGKCDTFGNLAFKSSRAAAFSVRDDVSDVSSASPERLEDLAALILEEHAARVAVESDLQELEAIHDTNSQEAYKNALALEQRRRDAAAASEEQLNELLRDVRGIVDRPLNQTNMELLRRLLTRQEMLQRQRDYNATKMLNAESALS